MNRRILYALALLSVGLMLGLMVGRFFMPDRYGLVTMILLFVGGVVTGALAWGAWNAWRGTRLKNGNARPLQLRVPLGSRAVTIRWDEAWWQNFEAKWLGVEQGRERGIRAWWDAHWAHVEIPNALVVLGALGMATLAQLLIVGRLLVPGLVLYALAGIVLMVWMWRQRASLFILVSAARIGRRAELILLLLILLLAFGARMMNAGAQPVGIDGDELKWTAQAYYDFIAKEKTGDFSGQLLWTPVSFYVNKVAFDLFGVDFNSPRIMTALLSVIATFVFYFVARDMFNVFVALIATLFMAASYYDVNASRQAIVQTFTKLPIVLALFLVIRGVDRERWFYFLLCGIVLYIGILTYDTFFVVPPVILMYLIFRGVLDWRRAFRWLFYLALVIAPMLLAYPIVADTIKGRQYTYVKGVSTGIAQLMDTNALRPVMDNTLKSFAALFQELQGWDYALDWRGPLINPLVSILLVLGFALVLARFWQRHNLLLILSFVIFFFPAPILSGYTVPRVFYAGLPPVFIFAGVALAAIATAVLNLGARRAAVARFVSVAVVMVLLVTTASDLYVYANELRNEPDWLKRRSLVQAIQNSVKSAPLTLIPVTRSPDDYVWGNAGVVKFIAYTAANEKTIEQRYRVLPYAELPGTLGELGGQFERVNILYDKGMSDSDALASSTIETIKRCYGNVRTRKNAYFDIYTLDANALQEPNCYSLASLEAVLPNPDIIAPAGTPIVFEWQADSHRPTEFQIQIEQRSPKLIWLEAENFPREKDWMFEAKRDHYPDFSGEGYLLDAERAGETRLTVQVLQTGLYQVWVRYRLNAQEGHRTFISVNGQQIEFANPAESPLEQFVWENVGEVNLTQGETVIALSREYGAQGWKPILLDAIFLSADRDFNPEEDELWTSVQDTGQIESSDTQYILESGLPAGEYRWRVRLSDGDKLVDASGRKGVWSEKVEFRVH